MVTEGLVREVFFGFDATRLLLRIDTAYSAADDLNQADEIVLRFLESDGVEIRSQPPGVRVAVVRMLLETLEYHALEPLGQLGALFAHRGWRILDVHASQLVPVIGVKRHFARRGFIERDTLRVEIDSRIEGPALRLLG